LSEQSFAEGWFLAGTGSSGEAWASTAIGRFRPSDAVFWMRPRCIGEVTTGAGRKADRMRLKTRSLMTSGGSAHRLVLALSAAGLANIPRNAHENDFTFDAGDCEFVCPAFVAEFLSPHLCSLRRSDPTINSYRLSTPNAGGCFPAFLSLGFGSAACFHPGDFSTVVSLCRELKNSELYESIFGSIERDLTEWTVLDRIILLDSLGCSTVLAVEFAAAHFYVFSESDLSCLSDSQLRQILSCNSLRIESEDCLYGQIRLLIERDRRYCSLLEFVSFEFLSSALMTDFIELISVSFEFLNPSVWSSLRLRLIDGLSFATSDRVIALALPFRSESPSDGIISWLTETHGGNVCDLGIVSVTSSSVNNGREAKHAVDFGSLLYAQTKSALNSWLCYDFKGMRVDVSHYSIRTRPNCDNCHPRTWTVEGSMDGRYWIELDHQEGRTELFGLNKWTAFPTARRAAIRMIRLRQNGKDNTGSEFLTVGAFELFGTLSGLRL
jgi:hypothetical protein